MKRLQVHCRRSHHKRLSATRSRTCFQNSAAGQRQCASDICSAKCTNASAFGSHARIRKYPLPMDGSCAAKVNSIQNSLNALVTSFFQLTLIADCSLLTCYVVLIRFEFGNSIAACLHITATNLTNIYARKDPDRYCSGCFVGAMYLRFATPMKLHRDVSHTSMQLLPRNK